MEKIDEPTCPEHLDRHGKKLWKRCVLNLKSLGKLHNADFDLLEQYCFVMSQCRLLEERISDEGVTQEMQYKNGTITVETATVKVYMQMLAKAKSLADGFGFSPKGRKELGNSEVSKPIEDKFNDFD